MHISWVKELRRMWGCGSSGRAEPSGAVGCWLGWVHTVTHPPSDLTASS